MRIQRLALRAKMRAALADKDALDRRTAGLAGFAGVLIHLAHVLEAAIAVDPVDAGAVFTN